MNMALTCLKGFFIDIKTTLAQKLETPAWWMYPGSDSSSDSSQLHYEKN